MNVGIKSWTKADRPREKLIEKGAAALTNAEFIAILLSSGNKKERAVDLARRMLNDSQQQLKKFSSHTVQSLSQYAGVGVAKAVTILAAIELGNRRMSEIPTEKKILTADDIFTVMYRYTVNQPYETFWVAFLNMNNCLISTKKISDGGLCSVTIDPKKIIKLALDERASSIILCHNHPSGNLQPSNEDIFLTKTIHNMCNVMGITLTDHIIICDNQYFSFINNPSLKYIFNNEPSHPDSL
ncbi:MAG: DNA repair protein RadC [Bacteroidales bacterium]|nr:DNA repair protein RadC [Bacteroidales bacterium]